jgi:adenine-specific DNA-methyltransferase
MMKKNKRLGQYFTTDDSLQQCIFNNVQHKGELLLEPAVGEAHLLIPFLANNPNYPMLCYEIDKRLQPVVSINENQTMIYANFLQSTIFTKFKTIIGNPPYIKNSSGNIYLKFIERCMELLDDNGEMLFIVPSDFIKITHASSLLHSMSTVGGFTHFWFPRNENLFEDATIDVMIFRYQKGVFKTTVEVNDISRPYSIYQGILTFTPHSSVHVHDMFDVYVGMVSGLDHVFKNALGNIHVLMDKNKTERFIYLTSFPSERKDINQYLEVNKSRLLDRKLKKFTDKNWFTWGAPRNIPIMELHQGSPCIYMYLLTRKKEVAFVGKVQYFTGTLLCMIPKGKVDLKKAVEYFNSDAFQQHYMYSGRFKIGQRQLLNSAI